PGFGRLDSEEKLRTHIDLGVGGRFLILPPFMHGAGQWSAFNTLHRGGTVILPDEVRRLDGHGAWRTIVRERVDQLSICGDAFAQPLLTAPLEGGYDTSSIRAITSTAAVLSPSVKRALAALLPPGTLFIESLGASEAGLQAMSWNAAAEDAPAYQLRDNSVVLSADRTRVLTPGADEVGWIATKGHLPLGYLADPERTRETFPVIDGVRYCLGGDRARYADDGRLVFLGRESSCINTGGEKVYVEEVERVVKSHPAVYDALVVGTPSPRWGQQVTAVVSLRPGAPLPSVAELRAHCAPHLADFKIPRAVLVPAAVGIEIARVCGGVLVSYGVSYGQVAGTIRRHGTPEQVERWVPGLMSGEIIGAWGLTEPGAGSDAFGSMITTARPDGDGYVIKGQKTFITNAPYADVFIVYAKLVENGARNIQPFLIERGTVGLEVSKPFRKMGTHSSPTGAVYLDDVRIPRANLLGGGVKERDHVKGRLSDERAGMPTLSLGLADRAFELAL